MMDETQSVLDDFFTRYADAISSRNPSGFAEEHFDRLMLCDTDRLLPFALEKSDQRALARSEQQRKARAGRRAVSFEIRDMVGGAPGQMPGHLYITVTWHLHVRPLVEKAGDDQVTIGYLLRFEDDRIDILAASVLGDGPAAADPPAEEGELADDSENGLPAGHRDGGAGYIAG